MHLDVLQLTIVSLRSVTRRHVSEDGATNKFTSTRLHCTGTEKQNRFLNGGHYEENTTGRYLLVSTLTKPLHPHHLPGMLVACANI